MKILHVVPSYVPAYRHGGAVKVVHELCKTLVKKGLEILVITTNDDGGGKLNVPLNKLQEVEGVRVIYCPIKFINSYYYSNDLSKAIREKIENFDLVHIHSVYLYPTFIAAHLCRRYKKPYIINPFGALDPAMISLKNLIKKTIYIKLIEQRNVENAAAIHVASDYEKEKFMSLGFKVPTVIVPRGLALEDYEYPQGAMNLREKYPKLKGKKIILFLGRIHFKKGFDLLAEAFKKVVKDRDDVHLLIVGPDEERYLTKVKQLFSKLGIIDQVLFIGMLLGHEKLSTLYGSDIFILPSYGENFGVAVLEAMACKLPVIITNRVGLYPDVKEYKAGIVTDCDSDQIACAILRLLDNEKLRKTMGENGRRLVEDKFGLDKIADKMIGIYKDICLKKN